MLTSFLTKQDYKRWQACPTSAHYGWQQMPSSNDSNTFMKYLAEEGKIIGELARRLFSGGQLIEERNSVPANTITRAALRADVTLFEACIVHDYYVIRPDILIRRGDKIYLIEVKSKLGKLKWHTDGKMLINIYGDVRAAYRDIVHDLAFQVVVLEKAFPDLTVVPYFLLPEETKEAKIEEVDLARMGFELETKRVSDDVIEQRRNNSILEFFNASKAIAKIREETGQSMDAMGESWGSGQRPEPTLRYQCRNCEFRLKDGKQRGDGFHQCWGALADPDPHLFSLYQLYSLKQADNKQALLADQKISQEKTSLYDISEAELHGEHQQRQSMQLRCTKSGEEWIDPKLGEAIASLSWTLAFVDFETSLQIVPWYADLKPGQIIPFQFSTHLLDRDGNLEQREWLNTHDEIPTLQFIRELKSALEGAGHVFVYTDYENRILKESVEFLTRYGNDAKEECAWIIDLLHSDRIIDQHEWVYKWYQNPLMNRTSIKTVMPSIWKSNSQLHQHKFFKDYYKVEDGKVLDPYKTLPSFEIDGIAFPVREGTGAMVAYKELILGRGACCEVTRHALANMLRNYVSLDTLSQVMIFEHWRQRLDEF